MNGEGFIKEEAGSFVPVDSEDSCNKPDRPEKKQGGKKNSGERKRLLGFGAAVLALCVFFSFISGAAGAYLTMSFFPLLQIGKGEASVSDTEENTSASTEAFTSEKQTEDTTAQLTAAQTEKPSEEASTQPVTAAEPIVSETVFIPAKPSKSEIYANGVNSVVSVKSLSRVSYITIFGRTLTREYETYGSGFFITSDGYILTNCHVVEGADKVSVTTYGGKVLSAKTVGTSKANDIAVLKVSGSFTPVTTGDSDTLAVGDEVLVIGNAMGKLSFSFTNGLVSYLNRAVAMDSGKTIKMFQTNAAINQGNSGGPVYNSQGEVIGIASAKYDSDSGEGLGFCIPINDAMPIATRLIKNN